jgi:CheY-like chemotaxis protein
VAAGDRRLCFEVEDTGPGIAPEELDAVFDPFRQTKSGQASQEGTGLGMPISREFVRLMGGDLTVRSELGAGTLFEFDVQIALADAGDIPAAQAKRRVVGLEPDQPVFRLLVVEDREPNRRLLVKMLAPLGFEMYEAVNGQEGIEMWERYQPHLVWMDMRMPVMDGHEATQRIKATTMGQATVVVALTASAFERDRAMILSGGCDDFVRKPFREEEILDVLAKHLGVRFVYEEDAQPGGVPAEPEGGVLSAADLAGLPPEWVASLYEAAAQLDADLVLDRIEQVRASNAALADGLARLVRDFRFDVIMAVSAGAEGDDA